MRVTQCRVADSLRFQPRCETSRGLWHRSRRSDPAFMWNSHYTTRDVVSIQKCRLISSNPFLSESISKRGGGWGLPVSMGSFDKAVVSSKCRANLTLDLSSESAFHMPV